MIVQPKTKEEVTDLRAWLVSLVEDMPAERLVRLANAVEDAAFAKEGSDPFYSDRNMEQIKKSALELDAITEKG